MGGSDRPGVPLYPEGRIKNPPTPLPVAPMTNYLCETITNL